MLDEKVGRIQASNPNKQVHVSRAHLNNADRKRILERFVENDEALGQLLDFISNHYINKPATEEVKQIPSLQSVVSSQSGAKTSANGAVPARLPKDNTQLSIGPSARPQKVINVQSNNHELIQGFSSSQHFVRNSDFNSPRNNATEHSAENTISAFPKQQISSVYFKQGSRKSHPGQAITAYVPSSHHNQDSADGV